MPGLTPQVLVTVGRVRERLVKRCSVLRCELAKAPDLQLERGGQVFLKVSLLLWVIAAARLQEGRGGRDFKYQCSCVNHLVDVATPI